MEEFNQKNEIHLTYNQKMTVFDSQLERINFLPGGLGSKTNPSTIILKNNSKKKRKKEHRKSFDFFKKKSTDFGAPSMTNQNIVKIQNNFSNIGLNKSTWNYLNHRGHFVNFSTVINGYLENHYFQFMDGKKVKLKLNFNMNGDSYRLKFHKSGKKLRLLLLSWIKIEIPIYRAANNSSDFQQDYLNESWQFNEDNNIFMDYQWYENDLLSFYHELYERDYDKNRTFHIRLATGKCYKIDFCEMTQQNLETKYERKIRVITNRQTLDFIKSFNP